MTATTPDTLPPAAHGVWLPRPGRGALIPLALFAALASLPAVLGGTSHDYLLDTAIRIMIFALAAMSLDLILGYGAMVSFGHAAFIGVGAYSVGILYHHGIDGAHWVIPVTLLASGFAALVIGAISLRTRGVHFIMITLAFGQMLYYTTVSLAEYGGDDGLTLWGRTQTWGLGLFENDTSFYYIVFACLAGGYLLLRAIVASRFGRVLAGCRENEGRMVALGFSPYAYRLVAFVIAGVFAGVAGALLANHTEFVSPSYGGWYRSADLIIIVVLGGMMRLHGAIYGALLFMGLEELLPVLLGDWIPAWLALGSSEVLDRIAENWKVLLGPVLVLVALTARGGIVHLLEGLLGVRRREGTQ